MTATDDAREVLALAEHYRGSRTDRLARTLLALTGEQAVEAAARALGWKIHGNGYCDEDAAYYLDCARATIAAALAAAEEAP